jgi:hypothetical protein
LRVTPDPFAASETIDHKNAAREISLAANGNQFCSVLPSLTLSQSKPWRFSAV